MATKVEQSSPVEPGIAQSPISAPASSISPKVSMFGAKKSGFVIPKNKLSGRLVPMFRGGGKVDAGDAAAKEDSSKQVQRKTKWGVDLNQDASVRRGRALAYQTRVDQITKQLKSGDLEIGEDQSSQSPAQASDQDSSSHQIEELGKRELLELEKQEAIGEILRLNPGYKAPADYKPLLKEAKVPIPLKAYPGYNFIGLLLGPESNTQKRLEEETGAKIRVQCTKAGTGEKKEITLSDGNDVQADCEELYVHISAETFEKVDAAVALIELLVTPVSGSLVSVSTTTSSGSGDHVGVINQVQSSAASYMMPVSAVNQGLVQPIGSVPSSYPLVQFQSFSGPWVPHGPPNTTLRPPSGFMPHPNPAHMPNNSIRFPPSVNPFNTIPFFGVRPSAPGSFGSVPRNPSLTVSSPHPPMQVMQRPFIPETRPPNQTTLHQNHPMQGQQPQPTYPAAPVRSSSSIPAPFAANQPMPTGPMSAPRPPVVHSIPQPVSAAPSGQPSNQLSTSMPAVGNSSGWSGMPNIPPTLRPSNIMQMIPPPVPQSSHPIAPQSANPFNAQSSMPGTVVGRPLLGNAVPPGNFLPRPSTPQLSTTPINHQATAPTFASGPHAGAPPMTPTSSLTMPAPPMLTNSVAPSSGALLGPSPRPLSMPTLKPAAAPVFSQAPTSVNASSPSVLGQAPSLIQSSTAPMPPVMARGPVSISSSPPPSSAGVSAQVMPASQPPLLPSPGSVSGSMPSFSSMKPPMTSSAGIQPVPAPKPQRPSSSDFTFQPQRPQLPASQNVPRPTSQAVAQNTPMQPPPAVQLPSAPQAQSFRPAMNNSAPPAGIPSFPRLPTANQMGQPQSSIPPPSPNSVASFSSNQVIIHPSPRVPSFPNPRPGLPSPPSPQMRPPNFLSAPQVPNPRGHLPIRPGNQLLPTNRPGSLMVQNQQSGYVAGRPVSSPSGGNQIYDPFSPTSIPSGPQQQGGRPVRKQETDAEYEDLMASVGVR